MKLLSITANRHVIDGRVSGAPTRLLLNLEGGRGIRMMVAPDGEAMLIDRLPLDTAFDMGAYGRVVVEDVTRLFDEGLAGANLDGFREILVRHKLVGVQLELGTDAAVHIWVDGDELWWGDDVVFAAHLWPDGVTPVLGNPIPVDESL